VPPPALGVPVALALPVGAPRGQRIPRATPAPPVEPTTWALRTDSICLVFLSLPQLHMLQGLLGTFLGLFVLYMPIRARQSSNWMSVLRAMCSLVQLLCALAILSSSIGLFHLLKSPLQVCTNTCPTARDGECDDAGGDSAYDTCSLGTDCADCGSRVFYREAFVFFTIVSGMLSLSQMVCATRVSLRARALQQLQLMHAMEALV